ncbi:MAG: 2-amino-4-hydroxy-6-hydroxymethyldihydropteridine diphosphokinase [Kiritimatiellae bacterium]|nr:2-amino-4-hydroxy-6-hydroxymethyldihydropteridine diphosphokinase [Kiritimatiellia bacterium]MDW8458033.1 2-amino-4-hydroxy-6-hydroxymethyldihydropteridine diphosphokinase [Verrucomicrobiota bacterium]
MTTRKAVECALSLGSCLGDRLRHLREARAAIAAIPGVTIIAASPVYETEPVGVKPEFAALHYLNAVLILETTLTADALRATLARIEEAAGRVRTEDKYAPRTLDIDILYHGDEFRSSPELSLPHPRWADRRFVVQPLADVRPDHILPGSTVTVAERLALLPIHPAVRKFTDQWPPIEAVGRPESNPQT